MEGLGKEQTKNLENNPAGEEMKKTDEAVKKSEEQEKLKKLNIPQNTKLQIVGKSIKISLLNWRYFIFYKAKGIIEDILEVAIPAQKGRVIDCITNKSKHHLLFSNFVTISKLVIIKLIFSLFFELLNLYVLNEYLYKFKDILIEDLAKKDMEFFDSYNTGQLIEKINNCQKVFQESLLNKILEDAQRIIKMLFLVYYLISTNFKIAIISLSIILVNKAGEFFSAQKSGSLNFDKYLKLDEKFSTYLTDLVVNIKLIKSFATEKFELERMKRAKREIYNLFINIYSTLHNLAMSLSTLGEYFILYYTGSLVISGKISFGVYSTFQTYITKFQEEFTSFHNSLKQYAECMADWKSFFEVYDFKPKIKSLKNYIPEGEMEGKVEFQNVKFSYPLNPDSNIFESLSFSIEPGKILALVGYSGSGKSTISNLIERFYDPIEGRILIDNKDIKDYNLDWLHKKIGLVSQEPSLSNGTIEYNITYGLKEYSKQKLDEVCEITLVNQFLKDKNLFPEGLNTLVGQSDSKVSGGQKQRIAIARAIMRDAKILVLDEATSALDAEIENEVQKALENLIKEKKMTTIIIAHRLSTVKNADKIIFLNKGEIAESGTHEELVKKNGEYKRLMSKQLS